VNYAVTKLRNHTSISSLCIYGMYRGDFPLNLLFYYGDRVETPGLNVNLIESVIWYAPLNCLLHTCTNNNNRNNSNNNNNYYYYYQKQRKYSNFIFLEYNWWNSDYVWSQDLLHGNQETFILWSSVLCDVCFH
jgi:hypothetical protein